MSFFKKLFGSDDKADRDSSFVSLIQFRVNIKKQSNDK